MGGHKKSHFVKFCIHSQDRVEQDPVHFDVLMSLLIEKILFISPSTLIPINAWGFSLVFEVSDFT